MGDNEADVLQEQAEHIELGADQWLERMRLVSAELMKTPRSRPLSETEHVLFGRAALSFIEMFLVLDNKLSTGHMPPRAWAKELAEPGQLPSSDLHRNLKAETEVIVQKLLEAVEKRIIPRDKMTGKLMLEGITRLLSTLALFTSESVRLACLNNIKPEDAPTTPHLALVADNDPVKDN